MEDNKFALVMVAVFLLYLIFRTNILGPPWWLVQTLWLPVIGIFNLLRAESDEAKDGDLGVGFVASVAFMIWPFLVAVLTVFQMLVDFIYYFCILPIIVYKSRKARAGRSGTSQPTETGSQRE